jgi:hypothetical protein
LLDFRHLAQKAADKGAAKDLPAAPIRPTRG